MTPQGDVQSAETFVPLARQIVARWRERWLALAHVGWVVAVVLDIVIFIPAVPLYYALLHVPCANTGSRLLCTAGQLAPAQIQKLHLIGFPLDTYAAIALATVLVASLVFFVTGALIAWRKWNDGQGLFVSLVLITFGATGISDTLVSGLVLVRPHPDSLLSVLIAIVINTVIYLQWPSFGAFLLTFPTGRFTPRWSWLAILLWVATVLAFLLPVSPLINTTSIALTLGGTLAIQIYRYRFVYGPIERQQTKWLVFAIASGAVLVSITTIFRALTTLIGVSQSASATSDLFRGTAFFLPVAIAVGIALLRYRLYDIDVIINRALVYGLLTAILAACYFSIVIGAQTILRVLTGQSQQPPILIVVSTLIIAALFQPLRRRLQSAIDRRFYRRRYDATKTVEAFGAMVRSEVDLARLRDDLLAAVEDTMRPTHASLWLSPPRSIPPDVPPPVDRETLWTSGDASDRDRAP